MSKEADAGLKGRLFGVACFLLFLTIVPTAFWSWTAYTYRYGEVVEVSYQSPCASVGNRRSISTECPASWVVDGVRHTGTITDHNGAELPDAPGVIKARAWGDTARTKVDSMPYRLGLVGPWIAIPSLLVVLLLLPILLWTAVRDGWADAVKARDEARNPGGPTAPG